MRLIFFLIALLVAAQSCICRLDVLFCCTLFFIWYEGGDCRLISSLVPFCLTTFDSNRSYLISISLVAFQRFCFNLFMSVIQEIDSIVDARVLPGSDSAREALVVAWNEVNRLLEATGDSLANICLSLEAATSKKGLREAFRRFNSIMRMFTDTVPGGTEESLVLETVASFESNKRFRTLLTTLPSVNEAVAAYKKLLLKDLAVLLRQEEQSSRVVEKFDDELFDQFLPESSAVDTRVAIPGLVAHAQDSLPSFTAPDPAKRGISVMAGDSYVSWAEEE